ncbi:hypothetical protein ACJ42G_026320 [Klebsiella pneumoniae]|uniref:hypothetical protein n=2 Tax=Klebsiella pneumoniae TaxID=573 RepID=UPI00388F9620
MIYSGFDGKLWPAGGTRKVYEDNLDNGLPYWLSLNAGASFTQNAIGSVGGMTISPDSSGVIDLNGPEIDLNTVRGISLEFICTGAAGGNVEVQAGFFSASDGVLARQRSSDNYMLMSGLVSGVLNSQNGYYELNSATKRFNPCVRFDTRQLTLSIGDGDQISAVRALSASEFTKAAAVRPRLKFINAAGGFTRRVHYVKLTIDWI